MQSLEASEAMNLIERLNSQLDTLVAFLALSRQGVFAIIETYRDLGRSLPQNAQIQDAGGPVWLETVVTTSSS